MARTTFHLRLSPKQGHELRYDVALERLRDDGARRWTEPIAPQPGDSTEFVIAAGWLSTMQVVRSSPTTAESEQAIAALSPALWKALPDFVRRALGLPLSGDEILRVVLLAAGRALELPWEALALPVFDHAQQKFTDSRPFLRGQAELVRRPLGVAAIPQRLEARRRALLVFGSLEQAPAANLAESDAAKLARALRLAGFEVVIAAGRPAIDAASQPTLRIDEVLGEPPRLLQLLRTGSFTLLHYVGHSSASSGADPMGARELDLEIAGFAESLALADLAAACRDGKLRCAVFSACDLRAHAADELLRRGELEHVVTMGAMAPVVLCARWSEGFYASLRDAPGLAAAVAAGRRALAETDFARALQWLPQHHGRDDVDLCFATEERVLIERYCVALCARLDAMEGRFRKRLDPARLADVFVELSLDERLADRKALDLQADGGRLPEDCTFAALVGLATKRFLLGGKPGAGKSTTLRVHARKLAEAPLREQVPVFVPLAEWLVQGRSAGEYERLTDFVARRYAPTRGDVAALTRALDELGKRGELLVMLDGLDELPQAARAFLDEELGRLAHAPDLNPQWASSRFVVSTRRYEHTIRIPGFVDVDIQDLAPARAAMLLAKVLGTSKHLRPKVAELARTWERRFAAGPRAWQELGKVPLFVTLIGELLIFGREVEASRSAFFREVFEHLCFDQHHGPELDPGKAQLGPRPLIEGGTKHERRERLEVVLRRLGLLALRMTEASRITATRPELERWLVEDGCEDPDGFLDEVARKTLILAPDTERELEKHELDLAPWRFWHRSFQEALVGWSLSRAFRSAAEIPAVLERLRLEPQPEEIAAEQERLPMKWARDEESYWEDHRRAELLSTTEQYRELRRHLSADGWSLSGSMPFVASILAPTMARSALRDFWNEPLAIALGASVVASPGLAPDFARGLIAKDRDLGRDVIERLECCPPALLALALSATSRSDEQVRDARNGTELYEGLTIRASERAPLYAVAPKSTSDPRDLARMLAARLSHVDDPGELFLIDEVLRALGEVGRETRAAVLERCGRFDPALFADHFVALRGGDFHMGSDDGPDREKPRHEVRLSPFAIGRTPVTVAMYRAFWPDHRMEIGSGLRRLRDWRGKVEGSDEEVDRLPVTYVSWFAARMFCRWLQQHASALPGWREGWTAALPREAEAEYAIRGGEPGAWSCAESALAEHAWFELGPGSRPHAVGLKLPNPFGLFDVHGNVWEWCEDAYGPYARVEDAPLMDPVQLGSSASSRVLRGGSFGNLADYCRSAFRGRNHPAGSGRYVGFRVVLAVRPPGSEWAIDDRQ